MLCQGKHIGAIMLHTSQIEAGRDIRHAMIICKTFNNSAIDASNAFGFEHSIIREVWQSLVHFIRKRICNRIGSRFCEFIHHPSIFRIHFKADADTGIATSVKIHDKSYFVQETGVIHKCL